jgi:hypothetical protein
MIRLSLTLCAVLAMVGCPSFAQTATKSTQAAVTKPAPKPASARQKLKSKAKGLALATDTVEAITGNQLEIATRVLTGSADCEFNQHVNVEALADKPGHFKVGYKNLNYVMTPEETSTGAVRLHDKKSGVVWLQIPVKSMLMNHKIGQRMVDGCTHSEQRMAVDAAKAAASSPAAQ